MSNNYSEVKQLSNGIWVFPDHTVNWGSEMNYNLEVLNALCAHKALNFYFGDELVGTFNGYTKNLDIVFPKPKTLTIKLNGEVQGTYNALSDSEIDIPFVAKPLRFYSTSGALLGYYDTTTETDITLKDSNEYATVEDIYNLFDLTYV